MQHITFDNPNFIQAFKDFNLLDNYYLLGDYLEQDQKAFAVIGSRKMSPYGKEVTKYFVAHLVKAGYTIVSGLAEGVDSEAQKNAIMFGGRTIGILGYGFNFLKEDPQYYLAKEIIQKKQGCLISPFKHGQKPLKHTFINRNKLIAAMVSGVLVIEATERSGTFHTVGSALDFGKNIYAVPGNIFSYTSRGTHQLIREGAILTESVKDLQI
ncbi:MAG TPA: DNA-processing protein DprA [Candidatus Saccharimonadales bacterium]|nr:DNA-processing protein DprA [Candidatus Saccharimonadales bacterium]